MQPHVPDRFVDARSGRKFSNTPDVWHQMMTVDQASVISHLMAGVVDHGTASTALRLSCGVSVASQDGHGAFGADEARRHLWVNGFAPADHPQLAFTVFVADAPETRSGTGATVAGPIAREVLEAALCTRT